MFELVFLSVFSVVLIVVASSYIKEKLQEKDKMPFYTNKLKFS